MSLRASLCIIGLFGVLLLCETASADPPSPSSCPPAWQPYPPSLHYFPTTFVANAPAIGFTIGTARDARPFAHCVGRCETLLLPGEYRVWVSETSEVAAGSSRVWVRGPSIVRIDAKRRDAANGVTSTGLALMGAGCLTLSLALLTKSVEFGLGGSGLLVAGLIVIPIGSGRGSPTTPDVQVQERPR